MDIPLLQTAFDTVAARLGNASPTMAIILGSGWGEAVSSLAITNAIPYRAIPGLGDTTIKGHEGRLLLAWSNDRELLIFQGRRHYYEGYAWEPVAIPIYVAKRLGIRKLLLTNAAGAINRELAPGSLMILNDHINLMGSNPLIGADHQVWGGRFPAQSTVYDKAFSAQLTDACVEAGAEVALGIYLAVSGPAYETPAEIGAFSAMGADAVGMSTVPEAMLANAAGFQIGAVSLITNAAAGTDTIVSHDEVVACAEHSMPRMQAALLSILEKDEV